MASTPIPGLSVAREIVPSPLQHAVNRPLVALVLQGSKRVAAKRLRMEQLAMEAGMGVSSFHAHFRAVTSLTPLQFQEQLRMIEARRLMLSDGQAISNPACAVGYESVPQFQGNMAGCSA